MEMIPVTQNVVSDILCTENVSYKEQEAEQLCAHNLLMATFTSFAVVCTSAPAFKLSLTPEVVYPLPRAL